MVAGTVRMADQTNVPPSPSQVVDQAQQAVLRPFCRIEVEGEGTRIGNGADLTDALVLPEQNRRGVGPFQTLRRLGAITLTRRRNACASVNCEKLGVGAADEAGLATVHSFGRRERMYR